jgi:hypothetical protein
VALAQVAGELLAGQHRGLGERLERTEPLVGGQPAQVVDELDAQRPACERRREVGGGVAPSVLGPPRIIGTEHRGGAATHRPLERVTRVGRERAARQQCVEQRFGRERAEIALGAVADIAQRREPRVGGFDRDLACEELLDRVGRREPQRGLTDHGREVAFVSAPGAVHLEQRRLFDRLLVVSRHVDDERQALIEIVFEREHRFEVAAAEAPHPDVELALGGAVGESIGECRVGALDVEPHHDTVRASQVA